MAVRRTNPAPAVRLNSLYLEKILKTQQNLCKPSLRIWKDDKPEPDEFDSVSVVNTLKLNTHPILLMLESCKSTLREFNQIHTQLIVSGLIQHSFASGRVIKKLCSSPFLVPHASYLYSHLDEPDAFLCNTIIRSYVNLLNKPDKALGFYYQHMVSKWVSPNHYTFPLLAKICAELGSIQEGGKTHARALKFGLELDLFVRNSMIHMYASFCRIGDAQKLFDASPESDLVTWNSMIDGYVKNGEIGIARQIFDDMPERDIVSWNSMIAGYTGGVEEDMKSAEELFARMPVRGVVSWNTMIDGYAKMGNVSAASDLFDRMPPYSRNVVSWNSILALYVRIKDYRECLKLFDKMIEGGDVKPNEATLVSVLTASANLGSLDRGIWIHSYINENERIEPDVLLSTALLTMYAKCGEMELASKVFEKIPERNVVSWNSMIMGYGIYGDGEKALKMFREMEKNGPVPNDVTFICVLSACTHAGMVLEGWWCFDLMQRVYKIEPKVEHYGCMVDLLGRAGLMNDSKELIKKMPMDAGPTLWGALLSSCKTHSNFELGEIVGKRLIELKPKDVGSYVLLSNIYAMKGKWDDVEKVRKMIKEEGLQKDAGFSLVDLVGSNNPASFVEDDASTHKNNTMYTMLSELGAQIKLSCRDVSVKSSLSL